jgi:histone-lysine N-methyltransferase SETMAR
LQKVYGETALSKGAISKWMKRFKDGREAIVDDSRVGRPVTLTDEETVAVIQEYILRDRRVSVEHVADKFAISYYRAQGIMAVRLGMRRVSARWVPRLLTSEEMVVRVKMCQQYDRRYREEGDYCLNRVITCDETWIHFFEPESFVWKHPFSLSPTKEIISKSVGKVMTIIFCDTYGFSENDNHLELLCNITYVSG